MPNLRSYQEEGVRRFLATPIPHRFFFTYEMKLGKTATALRAMRAAGVGRLLIVCPANVRRAWRRELGLWWDESETPVPGLIENGRKTRLTVKDSALRDAAYSREVQIVSYDLLGEIDPRGWEGVIIDEFHHLQSPITKVSKRVAGLFAANPGIHAVGLSGTPIPNEIQNLWFPLHLFWPNQWGRPTRAGDISWKFKETYCNQEEGWNGHIRFYGAKPGAAEALAEKLKPYWHRVTMREVGHLLPKLEHSAFYAPANTRPVALGAEWAEEALSGAPHVGVFTHYRQSAEDIAEALQHRVPSGTLVACLHGGHSTRERDEALQRLSQASRSVLVATTHAFQEGVDLTTWSENLVVEWTMRPVELLQFFGRFARRPSDYPQRLQYLVREGTSDEAKVIKLSEKLDTINSISAPGAAESGIAEVFKPKELTDDEFFSQMYDLITTYEQSDRIDGDLDDEEEQDA